MLCATEYSSQGSHSSRLYRDFSSLEPQLPEAKFIFLSNSHTAVPNEESISDEDLYLIAAVQYCRSHGVVGTTWDMVDTDGRDLAGKLKFYRQLFSGKIQLEGVLL